MNGGKQPRGYTIIEVMIVLAVSGVMFLVAATFISGKQETSSFQAGVNEMASRIQDTLEQVDDGQYSDVPLTCTPNGSYLRFSPNPTGGQGTNNNCTFMGKLMQFNYQTDNQYEVFSLGGLRVIPNATPGTVPAAVTTLAQADISPIGGLPGDGVDLTNVQTVPQNLNVIAMSVKYNFLNSLANGITSASGIGFIEGLAAADGTEPDTYATGDQYPQMVYAPILADVDESAAANAIINSATGVAKVQSAQKIKICLSDGTRYAVLTIGTNNQYGLGVVTQLGSTRAQCTAVLT